MFIAKIAPLLSRKLGHQILFQWFESGILNFIRCHSVVLSLTLLLCYNSGPERIQRMKHETSSASWSYTFLGNFTC